MNVASPTFANPLFRQAIVKAVNRDVVVPATIPGLGPSPRVIPTAVPGSSADPCGDPCKYDPEAAKALLAQAFPTGVIPTVEIDTDDDPGSMKLASVVQLGLASVGIPVELKSTLLPGPDGTDLEVIDQPDRLPRTWTTFTTLAVGCRQHHVLLLARHRRPPGRRPGHPGPDLPQPAVLDHRGLDPGPDAGHAPRLVPDGGGRE